METQQQLPEGIRLHDVGLNGMNCPDCDRALHGDRCACGWVNTGPAPTGQRDVLKRLHAASDAKALEDAKRYNAEHGLDTREKQLAFIKKSMRKFGMSL